MVGMEPCVIACDYVHGNIGQLLPLTIDQCIITPMKPRFRGPRERARYTQVLSFSASFRGRFPTIIDKGNTYVNHRIVKYLRSLSLRIVEHTDDNDAGLTSQLLIGQRDETSGYRFCSMKVREYGCFAGDLETNYLPH